MKEATKKKLLKDKYLPFPVATATWRNLLLWPFESRSSLAFCVVTCRQRCRLTTLTASYSRSDAAGHLTEGQSSCSSIRDFSPSAVQSATIQPQSCVLKGKPPCSKRKKSSLKFHRQVWCQLQKKGLSVLVLPCSSACSTSDTQGDSRGSLNKNRHHASAGWTWNVYFLLLDSTGCMCD